MLKNFIIIHINNIIFKARTDADMMPYQYSSDMRGERTLQFYRNLNLEACIWEFENWFSMSELQQACGGEITTDGQVSFYSKSLIKFSINKSTRKYVSL